MLRIFVRAKKQHKMKSLINEFLSALSRFLYKATDKKKVLEILNNMIIA